MSGPHMSSNTAERPQGRGGRFGIGRSRCNDNVANEPGSRMKSLPSGMCVELPSASAAARRTRSVAISVMIYVRTKTTMVGLRIGRLDGESSQWLKEPGN